MVAERTMAGAGWHGYGLHRSLKLDKVENGYSVKARFPMKKTGEGDYNPGTEERQFVFYTPEEVVVFVTDYLNASQEDFEKWSRL